MGVSVFTYDLAAEEKTDAMGSLSMQALLSKCADVIVEEVRKTVFADAAI